jgi:uncharacterized protein (TIGR02147 family)
MAVAQEQAKLQNLLRERFEALRGRNPRFSVRAFARRVGVSPGTLSLILLGKRRASRRLAQKIADQLMLDPHERKEILEPFLEATVQRARSKAGGVTAGAPLQYLQLTADQFHLVAEWHYFAILNLLPTRGFQSDPSWIARRLGLSRKQVEIAVDRLFRLGLLENTESGGWRRAHPRLRTTDDVASVALRRSHDQTLELARESLLRDPVGVRDFTWVTLPIHPKQVGQAKELIRKFQDDLTAVLEASGELPEEVYRLAVQFFPLTRPEPLANTGDQSS